MFVGMTDGCVTKMMLVPFFAIFCIVCSLSSAQEFIDHDSETNATLSSAQVSIDHETLAGAVHSVITSIYENTKSIYKILSETQGNILFSPINIQAILGSVARFGARGDTKSQIVKGMHLPEDNKLTRAVRKKVINSLENDKVTTLNSDIEHFLSDATIKLKEFQDIARTSFVSIQLNVWLEGIKNATIKDMLSAVNATAVKDLGFVHAFNFTGEWETKFDKSKTKLEPFFVTPMQTKDVQMMHLQSEKFTFLASEELDCKMIELPFKGGEVSLVVLLPNKVDGLANLEAKLDTFNLHQLIYRTRNQEVSVSLPKFKIEQLSNLKEVLKKLGMTDMFGSNANFSSMWGSEVPMYFSKVEHNAIFEVNEEGTEGAVVTAIVNEGSSESQSSVQEVFKADHPFLFLLTGRWFNVILLMGRVSNP